MFLGHPETADGIASEVELDYDRGLVADYKSVVAGLNAKHLRCGEIENASVGEFHMNRATRQESYMRVHAQIGAHLWLHVF